MKNSKKTSIITSLVVVILLLASVITTGVITANNQSETVLPIFYRLAPEDENNLKKIVLADSRIQNLIKGNDYDFKVHGQHIKGQDWDLQVGAVLKNDITSDALDKWLQEGRTDKDEIEKYVGVLNIGHNDIYVMTISDNKDKVTKISTRIMRFDYRIPDLDKEDREKAVKITLVDPRVQELLNGKDYIIVPDSVVSWSSTKDHQKIGARLEISLDKTYSINYDWFYPEYDEVKYQDFPYYQVKNISHISETNGLIVLVDLQKGEVSGLTPRP